MSSLSNVLANLLRPPGPQQYIVLTRGLWGHRVYGIYTDPQEAAQAAHYLGGNVHRVEDDMQPAQPQPGTRRR